MTHLTRSFIFIHWTCASKEEAKEVILGLLEKRWIACATVIPEVSSYFIWKERLEEATEVKVILKSRKDLFCRIRDYIQKEGSYEVPEILSVGISEGNSSYLNWMQGVLIDQD